MPSELIHQKGGLYFGVPPNHLSRDTVKFRQNKIKLLFYNQKHDDNGTRWRANQVIQALNQSLW